MKNKQLTINNYFSSIVHRLSSIVAFCFIGIWSLAIGVTVSYAEDVLGTAKAFFLQRQYWQAIQECTNVINSHPDKPDILSEANYFAGASYINLFDFLTAKKNFKSIIEKYKSSAYYEDAYLGLGDIEFLQENFGEALKAYNEFLATDPSNKRMATLYFRLSEVYLKKGDRDNYKKYFDKLEKEFPQSFEAKDALRLSQQDTFYTVQVGAFTNYENAEKFITALKAKGYDVYSVLCMLSGKKLCRIRVGRCPTLAEAEALKERLELEGYPSKIFPLD